MASARTPIRVAAARGSFAPEAAGLQEQIATLTARVESLEKKAGEPVKAPLPVVNGQGATVFSVTADGDVVKATVASGGGGMEIRAGSKTGFKALSGEPFGFMDVNSGFAHLGLQSSGKTFSAGDEGSGMQVSVSSGSTEAGVVADSSGPSVFARQTGRSAILGASDNTFGFSAAANGSRSVALGDRGDGAYSLRVHKPGAANPVVQAGLLASGDPGLVVGDGANQLARVEGKDGAGVVTALKGGAEAVKIGKIDERTGLSVAEGDDQVIASVGGGRGADLSLFREGGPFFFVSTADGSGKLRLGREPAA